MEIKKLTDPETIKRILYHPDLINVVFSTDEQKEIKDKIHVFSKNEFYLGIYQNSPEELLGLVRCQAISTITVNWHFHLLPKYWGKGIGDMTDNKAIEWLIKNTNFKKVMIQSPSCCKEVIKACDRNGYKIEGLLTNAIVWNNNIEHLVIMAKRI